MRLCTLRLDGTETAAVVTDQGIVPVARINAYLGRAWSTDLYALLQQGLTLNLLRDAERTPDALAPAAVHYAPLYRHPRKIWGIGLNYKDHAADLSAPFPTEPASFMKGDHTIIGPGDRDRAAARIGAGDGGGGAGRDHRTRVPLVSPRRTCRTTSPGYCLIIDMTAEDILQRNPRFLTRAKNFDTFFSFGPELITPRRSARCDAPARRRRGRTARSHRENVVANMAFPPHYLVAFHSNVMTLYPGDIISTGTPGAVVIEPGDIAECRIEGLGSLANPVRRRIGIGLFGAGVGRCLSPATL